MPDPFWTTTTEGQNSNMNQSDNFAPGDWTNFWSGVSNWWNNSAFNPGTWQKRIQDTLGITNLKESVNSASGQGKIAYTDSGIPYDESNTDSKINALMQEYAYKRDDQAYDRLIAALKRNGINPAIALSNSASPMSSDSGYRSSYSLTDKDTINSALKAGSIIALLVSFLARK